MKSIYQDAEFAKYWNDRAGNDGEVFKRYVLDPLMFELAGPFRDKVILELGCGNGYLGKNFLKQNPRRLIMSDISQHNLEYASQKCKDDRIEFHLHDATERWDFKSSFFDVIYSNMLLNEINNIKVPISETYRTLKKGGIFVFSVTHPAWDLYAYAQEKAGIKSKKFKGLKGYFYRGWAPYIMGSDSKTNPNLAKKYNKEFEVEHYHRPISDYFTTLRIAGFEVDKLLEPEMNNELLTEAPRFNDYTDHPLALIFSCIK